MLYTFLETWEVVK